MSRCALYRHYDAEGRLLYVGMSVNPMRRLHVHSGVSPWFPQIARVEMQWFDSSAEAEAAETAAIRTERPLFNIADRRGAQRLGRTFPRKEWAGPLGAWMRANGIKQRDLAQRLGISNSLVSKFLVSGIRPGLTVAAQIERITNGAVPASSWTAPEAIAAE